MSQTTSTVETIELRRYRTVLLDLDGTVYLDWKPLPGAAEFVHACEESGATLGFLSNLSLWPKGHCLDALEAMGITVSPSQVLTAVDTLCHTAGRQVPGRTIARLTADHLARRLDLAGYRTIDLHTAALPPIGEIDALVVAQCERLEDRAIHRASELVAAGIPVYSTSTKGKMPTRKDDVLSAGEVVHAISEYVDFQPIDCGKPSQIFAEAAASLLEIVDPVLLVGDGLDTDIALANNNGWASLLVESPVGETDPQVLWPVPDFVAPSLRNVVG